VYRVNKRSAKDAIFITNTDSLSAGKHFNLLLRIGQFIAVQTSIIDFVKMTTVFTVKFGGDIHTLP